jgi:hypothetical protein
MKFNFSISIFWSSISLVGIPIGNGLLTDLTLLKGSEGVNKITFQYSNFNRSKMLYLRSGFVREDQIGLFEFRDFIVTFAHPSRGLFLRLFVSDYDDRIQKQV